MMSASIDTKTERNNYQENNLPLSQIEAVLKEKETIVSARTDTESETGNSSEESSGKMSHNEALPKDVESMKPECIDTQTETHHSGRQDNDQAESPDFSVLEPEKVDAYVPESMHTATETNGIGQEDDRSTRLEHNPSWSSSSHDLELAENKHSREISGLHFPTESQEFKQNGSNLVLQQDQVYSMQISKTMVVKKSVVCEGAFRATKDSEMITTVNKALEDISHAGKSVEEILDDMTRKNLNKDKPSTSVSPVQQKPSDVFVRKSFTCDNSMVDQDEELREHWTRTLQTSTSTGEIVEEIVRVLKHQKTHDLLCPVCGSCITKRVVLRKRKRSTLISVDRWYQDRFEEDAEIQVEDSSKKTMDSVNEEELSHPGASDEPTRDTMAYGCLACFSLFFQKGHHLWSHTEGAAEQDTISCLPFFFPPYPWGMNQRRKMRTGMVHPSPGPEESISPAVADVASFQDAEKKEDRWIDKCGLTCGLAPALSDFYWRSKDKEIYKDSSMLAAKDDGKDGEKTLYQNGNLEKPGVVSTILPSYPWGVSSVIQNQHGDLKEKGGTTVDEGLVEQEIHIKAQAHIKSVTASEMYKPQQPSIGPSQKNSVLIESLDDSLGVEKLPTNVLSSAASTGYAALEGLAENSALTTRPSTGFAVFEDPGALPEVGEGWKDSALGKEARPVTQEINLSLTAIQKSKSKGWRFPRILWSIGKDTSDDLTTPLLKKPEVSVSKPSTSDSFVSVLKIEPSGDGSLLAAMPLPEDFLRTKIPPMPTEPIVDDVRIVIGGQPSDGVQIGTGGGVVPPPVVAVPTQQAEGWEIVRSIVYGGLDISVASLGVTSSAAGGDAITRTVVYMGVATLFSGLIGFYHNVINLYYHHREHYRSTVGKTLLLHGTVAVISYVLFGMLSSVTYGLSFRESDSRDKKFALCCGVSFVSLFVLSLGKAHVTNRSFLMTVSAYIFGGFLAAIIGYLAGEHVSELLENWGI